MSLVRHSASIGGLTLVSRVFGFVRDMMIASLLGAGMLSDAFFVAFKIPNFMRRLFAEGAFNSAFVPLYASTLAGEGPEEARRFAEEVHAVLAVILIAITVLAMWFMPELMVVLAPGFDKDPAKYNLSVTLTRITFPYLLFISLVSLQGGILNSIGRFVAVASTPIIMNVCLIVAMIAVTPFSPTPAHALAIGVMVSGVAQYLWLFYYCWKAGVNPRLVWPRATGHVKRFLLQIMPAALGSSVVQINLVIDTVIASIVPGGVSYLYYADRISELPLGVIGIAVSTALLPMLSRQLREGKIGEALHSQNRALELSLLFGLPSTIALMVIPYPIINVMYEHGHFTSADTLPTFHTLIAYAVGLPAFLCIKIFASTFYANHDTKTPVKIAVVCVIINLCLNLALVLPMGSAGLALATSVAGWVNAISLGSQLQKRKIFVMDATFRFRIVRMIASSLAMGLVLFLAQMLVEPYFHGGLILKIVALAAIITLGFTCYVACLFSLKVARYSEIRAYFTRQAV